MKWKRYKQVLIINLVKFPIFYAYIHSFNHFNKITCDLILVNLALFEINAILFFVTHLHSNRIILFQNWTVYIIIKQKHQFVFD
jgi:hypothetical protein